MNIDQARKLLLLFDETDQACVIRAAYAERVKAAHPDTGQGHGDIASLQQARDLLLEALESQKCACKLCYGVGQVRSGMAWRNCSACGGKGETR